MREGKRKRGNYKQDVLHLRPPLLHVAILEVTETIFILPGGGGYFWNLHRLAYYESSNGAKDTNNLEVIPGIYYSRAPWLSITGLTKRYLQTVEWVVGSSTCDTRTLDISLSNSTEDDVSLSRRNLGVSFKYASWFSYETQFVFGQKSTVGDIRFIPVPIGWLVSWHLHYIFDC